MKRGLLGLSLLVFLTQVVSAQFFSGYGGFSLGEFFDRVDPQTIILVLLFFIFFALIFYALSRIFKDRSGQPNKGIAGTIAFAATSLIIYGLYRTGFNFEGIFFNLGFSVGSLYPILTILFLIIAGLLIWKLRFSGFLMIFGLFIILLTIFTDIFYEKGLVLIIGIVLLVIGLLLWRGRRRRRMGISREPRPKRLPRERRPPREISSSYKEPMGYGQKARELRNKQRYQYYKSLEEQQKGQEQQQRRAQAREERRRQAREEKVRKRYTRRFGKRAWKKREQEGRNF
ncbi:hypothetical protein ES703_15637 [subsurface metagenome]